MSFRLAAYAIVVCALPLAAQEASVVIGGSSVGYADSLEGTAGWLGARLGVGRGGRSATLDAAYSRFRSGGWAFQLSGQGTGLWSAGKSGLLGFAAGASLNDVEGGTTSGTAAAGPLGAVRIGSTQVIAGGSAGAYRTIDGVWSALASGSVRGLWSPGAGLAFDLWANGTVADTLRFLDLAAHLRIGTWPLSVGTTVGTRLGDLAEAVWGSADLNWRVAGPVVLEAAAGRYPADVTGFTDGLYAQLGVRLFALRSAPMPLRSEAPIEVRRLGARRARVTLRYAGRVEKLEIAGDWNAWTPAPLTHRNDGTWAADLDLPPGAYTFALLADGAWVLPTGVTGVDDGLGGKVGVLVVRP